MLTPKEVKHLFDLARIEVSKAELEQFPKELNAIFSYIEELKKAPVEGVSPTLSFAPVLSELREDEARSMEGSDVEFLVHSFPESKNGYLKTKKVFE